MPDLLSMKAISKVYGNGIYANRNVDFAVRDSEIHALVGENGAGKSTLMKILFGLERPDSGTIAFGGSPVEFASPQDAMKIGIGMVHQHFMLVPSLTVAENVTLGFEPKGRAFIDRKQARLRVQELSEAFDLKIDPDAVTSRLAVGIKQKVEILKALYRGAKILILDEPTAVLTPQETTELFVQLKALKQRGFTVIFISHKLREVKEISDRISVLRRGEMVATVNTGDVDEADISSLMIGGGYAGHIEKSPAVPRNNLLEVRDVKWKDANDVPVVNGVTFSVRAGEIVGIAGVEGNGQDELIELITGLKKMDSGEIAMFGRSIQGESIRKLRDRGMAYIPSDRMTLGSATGMSIENNLISTKINDKSLYAGKLLSNRKIAELGARLVSEFRIKCGSAKTEVGMLSGGNIQKVVVAREFTQNANLIIAEQPTRGIDIGAAEFIHQQLVKLRDSGCGVLLVSADLDELIKLSDSIIVLHKGQLSAYIEDAAQVEENELGHYMLGVSQMSASQIGRAYHAEQDRAV